MLAWRRVRCFQLPIGPSQTSGGALADWRTMAVMFFSVSLGLTVGASVAVCAGGYLIVAHTSPVGRASSSPVQSVPIAPPRTLTVAKPELPSTFSAKVMRSGSVQASAYGDALMLGVRFCAVPPSVGTT